MSSESMCRCECLESVLPSMIHCLICHKTFASDDEYEEHTASKCIPYSLPTGEGKEISDPSKAKESLKSNYLNVKSSAGKTVAESSNAELDSGLIRYQEEESISPYHFEEICFKFVTKDSNRDMVKEIGLIGSNGSGFELCITTPSFSVQVNGELAGFFRSRRGIRQGCSLSPYLFVICMNVLSAMLDISAAGRNFGYHPKCTEQCITHLCFADDILVFMDGKISSFEGISNVLEQFAVMSGLRINPRKTKVFLTGHNDDTRRMVVDSLGYIIESLPIRYLGLPLLTRKMTSTDYAPLLEKIKNRLTSWSTRFLSFAGRYQLLSTVISGIIQFWAAAFWIPRKCIQEIEKLCSGFLWSGSEMNARKAKISWKEISIPRNEGGLGFRDIKEANTVYGLKLIWKLLSNKSSIWTRWVQKYLMKGRSLWGASSNKGSWAWKKMLKLRNMASGFTRRIIGSGSTTDFWFDNWAPPGRLFDITGINGPRQVGIPLNSTVCEAVQRRGIPRSHRRGELNIIDQIMDGISLTEESDDLLWRHGERTFRSQFSTKNTWEQLRTKQTKQLWSKAIWFPQAVPKYSFMVWLALKNRLSTLDRIINWMPNGDPKCVLCSVANETRDHLFFSCSFSRTIWRGIARNLMERGFSSTWTLLVQKISKIEHDKEKTLLFKLAFQTSLYHIWWERNNRRHNYHLNSPVRIIAKIDKAVRNKISALRTQDEVFYSKIMIRWLSIKT